MRVLIVEDEAKLQGIAVQSLKASGLNAEGVTTAQEARTRISAAHFDLLILDLGLPDSSGTELLREIREQHDMPVLIITARGNIESKIENFAAGADDYLTKPFALAELTIRAQALLRRRGPTSQETTLALADLELNRLTRAVQRGGKRIELSAREFALLEYLLLNAGKPLTRSMLVEKIWDPSFVGVTNVLDVYIGHLRRKIDEEHDTKLIRTVRGLGYVMTEGQDS